VPTEEIMGQATVEGMMAQLFRIEKDLLFDIIKLLRIDITPLQREELMKPCSSKPTALMLLFRGVDASDRGNYDMASDFYQRALKEDPSICTAQGAIQELRRLGLFVLKKQAPALLRDLRDSTSLTNQLTPKEPIKREFPTSPPGGAAPTLPCPACP